MSADFAYPLLPIVAFLGFFIPLIPLTWHLQALNSGTCYFIFWSSLASFNQFVNSVVWRDDALNRAPAWCEISTRIIMGAAVGIPAASLCINRRLYLIASVQTGSTTLAEKRRAILIDTLICIVFPLLYIALQYVVQGHRFNVLEGVGCYPALYNSLPAFFISSAWPIIIGCISAVYCVLSLRYFARRRADFNKFLSSKTSLSVSRYFRLMALAMTDICATVPLGIFTIYLNATATPVGPWISWADTHFNFSRVELIPAVFWRANHTLVIALEFSRYIAPVCSFIFFAFFGFAQESRKNYRLAWTWISKRFNFIKRKPTSSIKMAQLDLKKSTVPPSILPLHDLKQTDLNSQSSYTEPKTPFSPSSTFAPSFDASTCGYPSPPYEKTSLHRSRTL